MKTVELTQEQIHEAIREYVARRHGSSPALVRPLLVVRSADTAVPNVREITATVEVLR